MIEKYIFLRINNNLLFIANGVIGKFSLYKYKIIFKKNGHTYAIHNIKIEYFTILNLMNLVNELNIEFFKFTLLLL